jgi:hypothetical protein
MKKAAFTALQIAVTIGILYFVFRDPAKRAEMVAALSTANPLWLLLGSAAYCVVELIAGVRWQILLRMQSIVLSWPRVFALVMIGLFFNFLIPGGTGGDVVKVFYLLKETPGQRATALLSVVVDRIIGLIAMILLASLLIAARWQWIVSNAETARYVWLVLAILGVAAAGLVFTFVVSGFGLMHRLPAKMPGRDRIAEIALAYNLYGRAWRLSLFTVALSVVAHIGYILTFYFAALAFAAPGTPIPALSEFLVIAPIVNTIAGMPISLGGVGVREGLFQVFLGNLCGTSNAVAVLISSTGYVLTLFWGLAGAGIYLSYRPSEHARLREIRENVAQVEHTVAELELDLEAARGREKKSP